MLRRIAVAIALTVAPLASQTLGVSPNSIRSVLISDVAVSDTVVNIAICTLITPGILLNVDNEIMTEISLTGTNPCAVTVARGAIGTTISSHRKNSVISGYLTDLTTNAGAIVSGVLGSNHGGAGNVLGIMKANGAGVVTAAVPGADYVGSVPGSAGQGLTANGAGNFGTPVNFAASATIDTTNATNITSGRLPQAQLPLTALLTDMSNLATIQHDLLFLDNTFDIGKSLATRPRDGFFSRNMTVGGNLAVSGLPSFGGVGATGTTGAGALVFNINPNFVGMTTAGGTVDLSTAAHTLPAIKGLSAFISALPCSVGEIGFATDAPSGRNMYFCQPANNWTLMAAGGAGNPPGGANGSIQINNGGLSFLGLPTITGDGTLALPSAVLAITKVNGTAIPANGAADQFPLTNAAANATWAAMPNCPDTSGHLNYSTASHTLSCGGYGSVTIQAPTTTVTVTAPVTIGTAYVFADASLGSYAVNLYNPSGHAGSIVQVKKTDATLNTLTFGGANIDGAAAASVIITQQWTSISLVTDGANWFIF